MRKLSEIDCKIEEIIGYCKEKGFIKKIREACEKCVLKEEDLNVYIDKGIRSYQELGKSLLQKSEYYEQAKAVIEYYVNCCLEDAFSNELELFENKRDEFIHNLSTELNIESDYDIYSIVKETITKFFTLKREEKK